MNNRRMIKMGREGTLANPEAKVKRALVSRLGWRANRKWSHRRRRWGSRWARIRLSWRRSRWRWVRWRSRRILRSSSSKWPKLINHLVKLLKLRLRASRAAVKINRESHRRRKDRQPTRKIPTKEMARIRCLRKIGSRRGRRRICWESRWGIGHKFKI